MPRQCDMIFLPALRLATRPFPPGLFAARLLAAVIRPPRLFLAILRSPPFFFRLPRLAVITPQYARGRSQVKPPRARSELLESRTRFVSRRDFRAAGDFRVGVNEREAAVRTPAIGELAHERLRDAGAVPEELHRHVLDDAEVPSRENVRASEAAQQTDLGRPAAHALDRGQALDPFLVGKARDPRFGQLAGREGLRQAGEVPALLPESRNFRSPVTDSRARREGSGNAK